MGVSEKQMLAPYEDLDARQVGYLSVADQASSLVSLVVDTGVGRGEVRGGV